MDHIEALPIYGWYGRNNSGDEAFRDVHRLLFPDQRLTWFHSGQTPIYQPYEAPRQDIAIVSAGDIIQPFYFDHIPKSAKIVVYGAGIAWEKEVQYLGAIKDRLIAVWVRNEPDVAPLRALGVRAFYTPDIVFQLQPHLSPAAKSTGRKRAYVIVTDSPRASSLRENDLARFFSLQSAFNEFAKCIDFLSEWYEVTFLPFSFDRNDFDIAAIYDIIPRLRRRDRQSIHIYDQMMTPIEMMNFVAGANLVVTMKFHGVVYSLMHEIPFLAISDARKVRQICRENGFGDLWQALSGLSADVFKATVVMAESEQNRIRLSAAKKKLVTTALAEGTRVKEIVEGALPR